MRLSPFWAAVLPGCLCPGTALADDSVALSGRELRMADLAKLSPGESATLGRLVAARLPAGAAVAISAAERSRLLHLRVPGRDLALRDSGTVRFSTPAEARRNAAGCAALTAPLDQGEYLDSGRVRAVPCQASSSAALRHDPRVGAPFATAPLAAGTYLGRVSLREGQVIGSGSAMRLVSAAGPVTIEREVRTLQPARAGQSIFVATGDGAVITSQLAPEVRK